MTRVPRGTVHVVHKDPRAVDWLKSLLASSYIQVTAFRSGERFLEAGPLARPACLILDIRLPGISGLELQRELNAKTRGLTYIYFTETQDTASVVSAVKQGAIDFIGPTVSEEYLVELVHYALERDFQRYREEMYLETLMARVNLLSDRERQVFHGLASGKTNRGIAAELGVCQKTVEMHRAHLMQKMRANSLAELVQLHCKVVGHYDRDNDTEMIEAIRRRAGQLPLPLSPDSQPRSFVA